METAVLVFFSLVALIIAVLLIRNWAKFREFKGEVQTEMYKVTWPGQQEVINMTVLVFVVTAIMTVVVWIVDLLLGGTMSALFRWLS